MQFVVSGDEKEGVSRYVFMSGRTHLPSTFWGRDRIGEVPHDP